MIFVTVREKGKIPMIELGEFQDLGTGKDRGNSE
jgi:hypothetical protein